MAIDIMKPTISVMAKGLEGKIILIYGKNNVGKTLQATRLPKPYVIAAEMGLNGISGVPYAAITKWSEFKSIVKQFTNPLTIKKVKDVYSTIVIDEVYTAALYCQDYICSTFGNGALTLADGDSKHNLYQQYEKEFFRQINLLANSGFTVVFIAHEVSDNKTGYITPKGDKRSINPIIDKADYVAYIKGNGVDEKNQVIRSTAYLAATNEFFARSRIEYTPTVIKEFTAENLEKAIQYGIDKKQELEGATVVSFEEQRKLNKTEELDFNSLIDEFNNLINDKVAEIGEDEFIKKYNDSVKRLVESYLGAGETINNCTPEKVEAVSLIVTDVKELLEER